MQANPELDPQLVDLTVVGWNLVRQANPEVNPELVGLRRRLVRWYASFIQTILSSAYVFSRLLSVVARAHQGSPCVASIPEFPTSWIHLWVS